MKKIFLSLILISTIVYADDVKKAVEPEKKASQTALGLYTTAKDASEYLEQNKDAILIDTRSPAELQFIGAAVRMDFHIPYKMLDSTTYSDKKGHYGMIENLNCLKEIQIELKKKNASNSTAIFIMCRSGATRSSPVVNMLASVGFTNVWTLTDGFEGGKVKDGKFKGERVKNGWLHSSLEWSWVISKDKLWFPNKYK